VSGATITLDEANFEDSVRAGIVIVDWWAPWCGPCRAFAPTFEKAAAKHVDVTFAKVNTDEQQRLAGAFQIRSIPTLMVFKEGVLVFSQPGSLPASALDELVDGAKKLDMAEVRAKMAEQQG
jgi:thioredoxin